ncbi:MAG: hypothetical protein J6M53_09170 [Bacteroidaceae bacterium]|nr:hypothetical protein [Bacteroidaceae bacterium]
MKKALLLFVLLPLCAVAQIDINNFQEYVHGTYDIASGGGVETDPKQYSRVEILDDVFGHRITIYGHDNETGKDFADEYTITSIKHSGVSNWRTGFIYCYKLNEKRDTVKRNFCYKNLKPEGLSLTYINKGFKLERTDAAPADQPVLAQQISREEAQRQQASRQQLSQHQQAQQPVQQVTEVQQPARPSVTAADPARPASTITPATGNTTISGRRVTTDTQGTQATPTTPATGNTTISGRRVESTPTTPTTPSQPADPNVPTTTEEALAILADPGYAWMVDDTEHCWRMGGKFPIFAACQPLYYTLKPSENGVEIRGRAKPATVAGQVRAGNVYTSDAVSKITFADATSGNFTIGTLGYAMGFRKLTKDSAEFFLNFHGKWVKARRVPRSELPVNHY